MSTDSRSLNQILNHAMMVAGLVLAGLTFAVGWDVKQVLAIAAIALTFVANVPYVINAVKGRTEPHVVTWVLLGIITSLAFVKQVQEGAEFWKVLPLLVAAIMNFVNCVMGRKQATYKIVPTDVACGVVAVAAIVLWRTVDRPLLTVTFLSMASLLAFIPTVRKAYHSPSSETLSTYQRNTVRYLMVTLAVEPFTLVTVMYPAIWVAVNGLFSLYLVARRQRLDTNLGVSVA